MWRTISRPASAMAIVALLALSGCGGGDEDTSAGAQAASPSTTVRPTTSTMPPATTTVPACADVGFSSNPDDRASDIKATGLPCAEAEALVRTAGPQLKGDGGPSRVEADGFVCTRLSARAGDHGPPSAFFECTSGAKKVSFVRT